MFWGTLSAMACTGITLKSQNGTAVVARTIEWGGSNLNSQYVIVPRGYSEQSFTPDGQNGMVFIARYGYVGLARVLLSGQEGFGQGFGTPSEKQG